MSKGVDTLRTSNIELNKREYAGRKTVLESTPVRIEIVSATGPCSASCRFCYAVSGRKKMPGGVALDLDSYRGFYEPRIGDAMRKAAYISFWGFGEILLSPGAGELLRYLNKDLEGVSKRFYTNGTPLLRSDLVEVMLAGRYALIVSLHASNAALHRELTGLDNFTEIIGKIRKMINAKNAGGFGGNIRIILLSMLTRDNIDDLPELIRLGSSLGVDKVKCDYIKIMNPGHIEQSCYFEKQRTNDNIDEARRLSGELDLPVSLPAKFGGVSNKSKHEVCRFLWECAVVSASKKVVPCTHVGGDWFGDIEKEDFGSIWNGTAYREFRNAFLEGRLPERCRNCTLLSTADVDDIMSHMYNRDPSEFMAGDGSDSGDNRSVIEALKAKSLI